MSRRRSFLPQAAVVVLLLAATAIWTGKAFPRIDPAERALVAATRAGAEAQCDCASASTHRAYLRCVSHAMKALAAGQLSKRGMHAAMRCAQRSSCGRAGKATCCMTDAQGHMQCAITTAAKCVAPPGSTTCVTSFASLCDAIDQGCRQAAHDINCCLPPSSSAGGAFVCGYSQLISYTAISVTATHRLLTSVGRTYSVPDTRAPHLHTYLTESSTLGLGAVREHLAS